MREKLIALLRSNMDILRAAGISATATLRLADHLIENGVIIPVRCKDCKWYAPNNEGSWIGCALDTRHPDDVPKADDFCSYGERRTDDST